MALNLSGDELKRIAGVMANRFTYATLEAFLLFEFQQSIEQISLGKDLNEVIVALLKTALKNSRDSAAAGEITLDALIEKLSAKFPDDPDLVFFRGQVEEARKQAKIYTWYPAPSDHFSAGFLQRRVSFIDRDPLRRDLKDLFDQAGAKVLLISGPEGCGKSYSYRFICYVCKQKLDLEPVFVDLRKWPANSFRPVDLVRSVSLQLAWGEPFFDENAQEWRQKQQLFDWLTGKIKQQAGFVWLVIDGYGQTLLPAETEQLIQELAEAADISLSNRMRLVLTGHSGTNLPANLLNLANHVSVKPLGASDYRQFFEGLIQLRGETVDDDVIDGAVALVQQKIDQDPANPKPLHLAVCEVVEDWFGA